MCFVEGKLVDITYDLFNVYFISYTTCVYDRLLIVTVAFNAFALFSGIPGIFITP